jgi:hypothetical protein
MHATCPSYLILLYWIICENISYEAPHYIIPPFSFNYLRSTYVRTLPNSVLPSGRENRFLACLKQYVNLQFYIFQCLGTGFPPVNIFANSRARLRTGAQEQMWPTPREVEWPENSINNNNMPVIWAQLLAPGGKYLRYLLWVNVVSNGNDTTRNRHGQPDSKLLPRETVSMPSYKHESPK